MSPVLVGTVDGDLALDGVRTVRHAPEDAPAGVVTVTELPASARGAALGGLPGRADGGAWPRPGSIGFAVVSETRDGPRSARWVGAALSPAASTPARGLARATPRDGGATAPVLVVATEAVGHRIATLIGRETGLRCAVVTNAGAALAHLASGGRRPASAALLDPELLRGLGGSALAHALRVLETPTFRLRGGARAASAVIDVLGALRELLEGEPRASTG